MSADLYAQWIAAQKAVKVAADRHGLDSEQAKDARKREDDLFRKLYYAPEGDQKAAG